MSRTQASTTPGAGIVPKARSDGTIDSGFLRATDVRSLFTGLMSALPTQTLTGLSTWVNQGSATVEDGSSGLVLYAPSNGSVTSIRGLKKTAPAAPYTITALTIRTSPFKVDYPGIMLGWTDGTKFHFLNNGSNSTTDSLSVARWSNYTTWVSADAEAYMTAQIVWNRLIDDGATVYFQYSFDGHKFLTLYSVAKSSGYLGANGYSNIAFMLLPYAQAVIGTIASYSET